MRKLSFILLLALFAGCTREPVDAPEKLIALQKGWIEIQDLSSALAGEACPLTPGNLVLDVCGAPGGKAIHAADLLEGKGQVVVRLSEDAIRENILHSRARLEKAEFQYQAILMGQGYKLAHLEDAPENIKQLARLNSGYNEAMAELHELEHTLSYCSIVAPISGAVSQICNTLYGAAQPGEALFYIVDTEHLKVGFDVLENELAKYQMGVGLSVTTVAYPDERHTAKVSAISPVIDDNGMVHIEALLEPHPHLMPGMTAFVTLVSTP